MTNPHSAPWLRVNDVVSNMPEFQKAFSDQGGPALGARSAMPGVVMPGRVL